jgi:hypothetical protein
MHKMENWLHRMVEDNHIGNCYDLQMSVAIVDLGPVATGPGDSRFC